MLLSSFCLFLWQVSQIFLVHDHSEFIHAWGEQVHKTAAKILYFSQNLSAFHKEFHLEISKLLQGSALGFCESKSVKVYGLAEILAHKKCLARGQNSARTSLHPHRTAATIPWKSRLEVGTVSRFGGSSHHTKVHLKP